MPPRIPNIAETSYFKEVLKRFDDPECQEEIDKQKQAYELWRQALESFKSYAHLYAGYDLSEIFDEDKKESPMFVAMTDWVYSNSDTAVAYRFSGAVGLQIDNLPLPELEPVQDNSEPDFLPIVVQTRMERELPGRIYPAELITDIYLMGGEANVGKLSGLPSPKLEAMALDETGKEEKEAIEPKTLAFQDLKDTVDLISKNLNLTKP